MKKYAVLGIVILAISTNAVSEAEVKEADDNKTPATKLEAFVARKGTIIIKEFHILGILYGTGSAKAILNTLVVYEPGRESLGLRGLTVEVTAAGKYGKTSRCFLDFEEAESLWTAIGYMLNLLEQWKDIDRQYTEVIFKTKGNFEIGFYQDGKEQTCFISSGHISKATCFIPPNAFELMKSKVRLGIGHLQRR